MYFRILIWAVISIFFQVFVLNYIQIEGYGTPLVCVLPLLLFPTGTPRWITLLTGFLIGIVEDMFINTPGITAATFTFMAMVQPGLLTAFLRKNDDEKDNAQLEIISASAMGWKYYTPYILLSALITSILFFTIHFFSFFNPEKFILCVLSSWLTTALFILAIELVRTSNKRSADR